MPIEKLISFHIEKQFPAIYREDGKELVQFVKEYYKFLETNDRQTLYNGRRIFEYRDIDTTLESMLLFFKNKYLSELPFNDETVRIVVKNILGLYRRKGTEDGLSLFFRLFYNEDIKVYYPSRDMLRPSDSEWKRGRYLEIKPNSGIFTSTRTSNAYTYKDIIGKQIIGSASKSVAIVDKINFILLNKSFVPIIFINDISGNFINNEGIVCEIDGIPVEFGKIKGSLSSVSVNVNSKQATLDNNVGDIVTFKSVRSTTGGSAIVTRVTENFTGIVEYEVEDGGWGYTIDSTKLIVSNQIIFLPNENLSFVTMEVLTDEFGNEANVIGQTDFSIGIRSANSSVSFDSNTAFITSDRDPLEKIGITFRDNPDGIFSLADAILRASVNLEPEKTRFEAIVSGSRKLGDLNNSGGVTPNDALQMLRYFAGVQTDQNIIDYIEGEFKDYLAANQNDYGFYAATKILHQSIVAKNDSSPGDLYPDTQDVNDVIVSNLINAETVSLIFDKIGDFTSVQLNSANFNDVPPAVVPMSGAANTVTLATPIDEAFDLSPTVLGTIVGFDNINPGIDYVNDVFAIAYDTRVVNAQRNQQFLTLESIPATISVGDEITQGGVGAKVTGIIDNTLRIIPYSYYGFNSSTPIVFGGLIWDVVAVSTDFSSTIAGFNAVINSITNFGVGKIEEISVTDSGYGYVNGEEIDIVDSNGRVAGRGTVTTTGQGTTGGFWSTLDSHLNGYTSTLNGDGVDRYFDSGKRIQDSEYYQEFSYEILSKIDISEYEQALKDTTHIAGVKVFGRFNFEDTISTPTSIISRAEV
jgi:hypothetical protein